MILSLIFVHIVCGTQQEINALSADLSILEVMLKLADLKSEVDQTSLYDQLEFAMPKTAIDDTRLALLGPCIINFVKRRHGFGE
jgi:hypothetical protein